MLFDRLKFSTFEDDDPVVTQMSVGNKIVQMNLSPFTDDKAIIS